MTSRSCLSLAALAALLVTLPGCAEEQVGKPHVHNEEFEITLCGTCGDVKEDGHVCKADARKCEICEKNKGAVLCCSLALNGFRDVILCRKCGEVAFTDKCCQAGIAACPKCGLHKASPGCCKIERAVDDGTGHAKVAGHD